MAGALEAGGGLAAAVAGELFGGGQDAHQRVGVDDAFGLGLVQRDGVGNARRKPAAGGEVGRQLGVVEAVALPFGGGQGALVDGVELELAVVVAVFTEPQQPEVVHQAGAVGFVRPRVGGFEG